MRFDDRNDSWFESEESTRKVMIQEVQRIRRRIRLVPVLLLATLATAAIAYKLVTREQRYEAEVVLVLREGTMPTKDTGLPLQELRELVASVLLPDAKLAELIERRNLQRLRHRLGMPWAINEVREQLSIEVWRNSFIYYDPENPTREASARIGLSVVDEDPDAAFLLAHDLAEIVMESVREQRLELAKKLAAQITMMQASVSKRLTELELESTEKMVAFSKARRARKEGLAQAYNLRLAEIDNQKKEAEKTMQQISTSQEGLADQIAAAGLDLVVELVGEKRPSRPENRGLLIVIAIVIAGIGSLLGSALLIGAFDSRVHDTDDVARLGLPVLGQVPGFPGDRVGSLEARGVQRRRIPSFFRWRSQR